MNREFKNIVPVIFFIFVFAGLISAQELKPEEKYNLALNFEQSGELEKAKELFAVLLKLVPNDFNYFNSLNRVCLRLKDYDTSIKLLSGRLEKNPFDYNLYGQLGASFYARGDVDNAYKAWDKGIAVQPGSVVVYRAMASYAIQSRAYDKAVEYYKRGEEALKNKGIFAVEIFNLYNALSKYEDAADALCSSIEYQPLNLGMAKSVLFSLAGKPEAYDKYFDVVSSYYSKDKTPSFKELMAYVYLMKKEDDKALSLIEEIDSEKKKGEIVLNFAQECFANRHYNASAEAYKYIIDNYPKSPFILQARSYYPRCLEIIASSEEKEGWKTISFPDTTARAGYVKAVNEYAASVDFFPPGELRNQVILRIGIIDKDKLNIDAEAEKYFSKIIESNIYSASRVGAEQNLAELKLKEGDFAGGEKLLEEIINGSIADSTAKIKASFYLGKSFYWRGIFTDALVYLNRDAYNFKSDFSNDALELSALITVTKNDSLSLSGYAKADYLIYRGDLKGAAEILKNISKSDNFMLAEGAKFRYAHILTALNSYPEAIKILEEISASDNSIYADNAYFSVGNIYYYGIKDFRSAEAAFEKLLASFPGSVFADSSREMLNKIKNKFEMNNDNRPNK